MLIARCGNMNMGEDRAIPERGDIWDAVGSNY